LPTVAVVDRHWCEQTAELAAERQPWIEQHLSRSRSQDRGLDYGLGL
jgi:hypothetical protein